MSQTSHDYLVEVDGRRERRAGDVRRRRVGQLPVVAIHEETVQVGAALSRSSLGGRETARSLYMLRGKATATYPVAGHSHHVGEGAEILARYHFLAQKKLYSLRACEPSPCPFCAAAAVNLAQMPVTKVNI